MGLVPGGILFDPLDLPFVIAKTISVQEQFTLTVNSIKHSRRGTSYISFPIHRDTDRCVQLSRLRAPASELRLAPARFDIAGRAAAGLACVQFRGLQREDVAVRHRPKLALRR